MKRFAVLLFGVSAYLASVGVILYVVGFSANFLTPTQLDGSPDTFSSWAVGINLTLIALFALQHSVMARPWFKSWWTRYVPESIERSTYLVMATAVLCLLLWQWQPIGPILWKVQHPWGRIALYGLSGCGWLMVLVATFLIDHFDLFGLRHVWLYFRGREYTPMEFVTPGPYRIVRHPMYVGLLLAFWAAPTMTVGHLIFSLGMSIYVLLAIRWEERDLVQTLGDEYADYQKKVPMLLPRMFQKGRPT